MMMVSVAVMVMAMVATDSMTLTAMTSSTYTSVSESIIKQAGEINFITAVYKIKILPLCYNFYSFLILVSLRRVSGRI